MIPLCVRTSCRSVFNQNFLNRPLITKQVPNSTFKLAFVNSSLLRTDTKVSRLEKKNARLLSSSKDNDVKDKIVTVPNLLCVGRIAVCPYLSSIIISGDYKTSLLIYSIAGFTDLVSTLTSLIVVQSLISVQDEVFQKMNKNTGFNNHTGLNF